MAGEVDFGSFGQETLAALLAAAGEGLATAFGGHAGAEAVLLLAGPLGGLVCAFGHSRGKGKGDWKGPAGTAFHGGKRAGRG